MFPFSFSSRKPGKRAVLFQGGQLTQAHVVRWPGRRPEIVSLDSFAVEGGKAGERAALQSIRSSLKSCPCVTLMDDDGYQFTQFDAPPVPREERREALRWSLRETVDYPVETASLSVLDIPGKGLPEGRAAGVLVVSADERAVRARAAPFEEAGVPLQAIDVPELAQRNIAALLEDQNRGLMLMHLGENGGLLTLTYQGELVFARRSDVSARKILESDPEQSVRIRERLVLGVQRSLDNIDRQHSHISVSRVVLSTYPHVEGLARELAKNIYVPVQELDLATVIDFPNVPQLRDPVFQSRNLLAIGAALRGEDEA
jgi:MSHA biogenesis protein MshI